MVRHSKKDKRLSFLYKSSDFLIFISLPPHKTPPSHSECGVFYQKSTHDTAKNRDKNPNRYPNKYRDRFVYFYGFEIFKKIAEKKIFAL